MKWIMVILMVLVGALTIIDSPDPVGYEPIPLCPSGESSCD